MASSLTRGHGLVVLFGVGFLALLVKRLLDMIGSVHLVNQSILSDWWILYWRMLL